jgi:hypothetical protein
MCPAGGDDGIIAPGERLEPGVAIDLPDALEALGVYGGRLRFAVGAIEVDGRGRVRPRPGPVVAGIDPKPPGMVRLRPGSSTGIGVSSAISLLDDPRAPAERWDRATARKND